MSWTPENRRLVELHYNKGTYDPDQIGMMCNPQKTGMAVRGFAWRESINCEGRKALRNRIEAATALRPCQPSLPEAERIPPDLITLPNGCRWNVKAQRIERDGR